MAPRAAMGDFSRRGGYRAIGCCTGVYAKLATAPVVYSNSTANLQQFYSKSTLVNAYSISIYLAILHVYSTFWRRRAVDLPAPRPLTYRRRRRAVDLPAPCCRPTGAGAVNAYSVSICAYVAAVELL